MLEDLLRWSISTESTFADEILRVIGGAIIVATAFYTLWSQGKLRKQRNAGQCLHCKYDLNDISSSARVCPECGVELEIARAYPRFFLRKMLFAIAAIVLALVLLVFAGRVQSPKSILKYFSNDLVVRVYFKELSSGTDMAESLANLLYTRMNQGDWKCKQEIVGSLIRGSWQDGFLLVSLGDRCEVDFSLALCRLIYCRFGTKICISVDEQYAVCAESDGTRWISDSDAISRSQNGYLFRIEEVPVHEDMQVSITIWFGDQGEWREVYRSLLCHSRSEQ